MRARRRDELVADGRGRTTRAAPRSRRAGLPADFGRPGPSSRPAPGRAPRARSTVVRRPGRTARRRRRRSSSPTSRPRPARARNAGGLIEDLRRRASASSRPRTRSAGGSSGTSTTARSSSWWRWRSSCGSPTRSSGRDPTKTHAMLAELQTETNAGARGPPRPRRGIYPPLLADKGLGRGAREPGTEVPRAGHGRARGVGRYPQETEAAVYFCCSRPCRTSRSTRRPRRPTSDSPRRTACSRSRSLTTAAGSTPRPPHGSGLQGIADRLAALGGNDRDRERRGSRDHRAWDASRRRSRRDECPAGAHDRGRHRCPERGIGHRVHPGRPRRPRRDRARRDRRRRRPVHPSDAGDAGRAPAGATGG